MRKTPTLITALAFALAAIVCFLGATWAAGAIERYSAAAVRRALVEQGYVWADVQTDGLRVVLIGEAPNETERFRALSAAGEVVDGARVIDAMDVAEGLSIDPPDFSVEILRNSDGINLIGLVPESTDREGIVASLTDLQAAGTVTDLLNSSDYAPPAGWQPALDFALSALRSLPRSKVSVTPGLVSITAITDSAAEKARLEYELTRKAGAGLRLEMDISAPRPVITPFTLRFLKDGDGARFDACSADTEKAREAIVAAAVTAGAEGQISCTIGLGVPSPDWAQAAGMGIAAVGELGAGNLTISDADVSLVVPASVVAADFDRVVGELESNLPEVFSLKAVRSEAETASADEGTPEFTATLGQDGNVQLRGRITDELQRDAVVSFARARFGGDAVYTAMRVDAGVPDGWPLRVLAGLEALGEMNQGAVSVTADEVRIEGVSGSQDTRATVARLLSDKLGGAARIQIAVRYDEALDPLANLPTPEECVTDLNAMLAEKKITFDPGSATITPEARDTIERLAERMKDCGEVPMEVGGHTDSQGRDEMNEALSRDRAQAVITAIREMRVLTGNLQAKGYGEAEPIASNDDDAGREANRRIEFKLLRRPATAAAGGTEGSVSLTIQRPADDTLRPRPRPGRDG